MSNQFQTHLFLHLQRCIAKLTLEATSYNVIEYIHVYIYTLLYFLLSHNTSTEQYSFILFFFSLAAYLPCVTERYSPIPGVDAALNFAVAKVKRKRRINLFIYTEERRQRRIQKETNRKRKTSLRKQKEKG